MLRSAFLVSFLAVLALIYAGCSVDSNPTIARTEGLVLASEFDYDSSFSAIGDYVWFDTDMDGIQGDPADEPGIEDVMVYLFDCDGVLLDSTFTDEEGFYYFDSLEVSDTTGSYYVQFLLPADADVLPEVDAVTPLLPIWLGTVGGANSIEVTDNVTAVAVFEKREFGKPSNGITKLYAQLLAAKLNIAAGADDTDVADLISEADAFLAEYSFEDWNDLTKDEKAIVNGWQTTLDDYNNGIIGPGHCENYWEFSPADQGADDTLDSDAEPLTGMTVCRDFTELEYDDTWDAGMYLVIVTDCTRTIGFWKNHAGI